MPHSQTRASRIVEPSPLQLVDVGAEAALLAGGGAAILLQLAHPAVGRGVARHSDFVDRPFDRLFGTLDFVYAIAFGDEQMVASVVRTVNRAHGPVHDRGAEAPYNAFDPQLQLWVAATLYHSAMQVQEQMLVPLDSKSADAVYRDYAALGTRLQMPAELWPADREAFGHYWRNALEQLQATPESAAVVRTLFDARTLPLLARPAMPLIRLVTTGLLPDAVRTMFELEWNAARQSRYDRVIAFSRAVYPKLPRRLRYLPRDRALARVRRASERTTQS